jgi:hypothetical protein
MGTGNPLQKQLEEQKFLHAVAYVEQSTNGPKTLTTAELAYLNQMLTDKKREPWRMDPMAVTIPTGKTHHFNLVSNPIPVARDILGEALSMAGNGDLLKAASALYSNLVLAHLFIDANRRTAALAVLWMLRAHRASIDPVLLEKYPVGDLRDPQDLEKLNQKLSMLIET